MLAWAARWRSGELEDNLLFDPELALYVEGWGRPGDAGFVAETDEGRAIGAAWYRRFTETEHGYGFIAPGIPELSVGVVPEHRGRGVGTELLDALVDNAQREGLHALSLSVEEDNPALRLYERLGFRGVGRSGNALTMRREILLRR